MDEEFVGDCLDELGTTDPIPEMPKRSTSAIIFHLCLLSSSVPLTF